MILRLFLCFVWAKVSRANINANVVKLKSFMIFLILNLR